MTLTEQNTYLACLAIRDALEVDHPGVRLAPDGGALLVRPNVLGGFADARGVTTRKLRAVCRRLPFRTAETHRDVEGVPRYWRVLSIDALDDVLRQAETALAKGR